MGETDKELENNLIKMIIIVKELDRPTLEFFANLIHAEILNKDIAAMRPPESQL
jgi:hypothetical protein